MKWYEIINFILDLVYNSRGLSKYWFVLAVPLFHITQKQVGLGIKFRIKILNLESLILLKIKRF